MQVGIGEDEERGLATKLARFMEAAAAASTFLPVSIDPVSETLAMRPSLAKSAPVRPSP